MRGGPEETTKGSAYKKGPLAQKDYAVPGRKSQTFDVGLMLLRGALS
jgi:hypothetical protein